jgi:prophage regulatory protein
MKQHDTHSPVIIRRKQLETKIGLRRTAIYDRIDPKSPRYDPSFPKPINLGGGKNPPVGWVESEVNNWLISQIEKSRSENGLGK